MKGPLVRMEQNSAAWSVTFSSPVGLDSHGGPERIWPKPGPLSVAGLHPRQIGRLLPAQTHLLLLLLLLKIRGHPVHKVGHGQPRQDHDGLVPDHEGGYDGQEEGDFEGVDVLGIHGVMKGEGVVVVVQQDAQPPQLQARLH